MFITSDAKRTSATAESSSAADAYAGVTEIFPAFTSRKEVVGKFTLEPSNRSSGRRDRYFARVRVKSPAYTSIIAEVPGRLNFVFFDPHRDVPTRGESVFRRMTTWAQEPDTWSYATWSDSSVTPELAVIEGLESLRGLIGAIRNRIPLRVSPEMESLIQRAAAHVGTPGNTEEWARRIADGVRALSD